MDAKGFDPKIPVAEHYASQPEDDDDRTFSSGGSLASRITQYRYEHGRRYHAYRDGSYYQPNDEQHLQSEEMNHHLYLLTLSDQLFRSPIEPSRAIDIGTGTGLWAIDLADRYPNCEVTGVDLSPVPNNSIPPNCNFEVDDANSEWTYPENHFDLVYVRGLNGAVDDWSVFYKEAYRCIAPDGYVEDFEYDPIVNLAPTTDPNVPEDNFYNRFSKLLPSAGEAAGKTFARGERMIREMESAGFVDIRQEVYYWPIGPWSSDPRLKEMGRWMQKVWEGSLEGWILGYFTRVLGWTYDQVQAFVAESRVIMRDRRYHAYHKLHCTYGRKPRPEEIAEKPEEMDTSNSVAS